MVQLPHHKLGPKCGENIQKLADAPSFYHTMSPPVGYGWRSKPSKHSYGFRYDIRHITGVLKRGSNGYCMILNAKCGENIQKLADAPGFYHTMSPLVGYGWGS